MGKNKVQNKYKNHSKSTKTIHKLKGRLNKLEMELKRLRLEFSLHEDKNDYALGMIENSLKFIENSKIPF